MDNELTMTTSESPMETASPRDVDISDEVLEVPLKLDVVGSRSSLLVWVTLRLGFGDEDCEV